MNFQLLIKLKYQQMKNFLALTLNFIMFIYFKIPTIVNSSSMISTTSENFRARTKKFQHFGVYEKLKGVLTSVPTHEFSLNFAY